MFLVRGVGGGGDGDGGLVRCPGWLVSWGLLFGLGRWLGGMRGRGDACVGREEGDLEG